MGVTCQILIRRPREGVHKAGKPVVGCVRYTIDEPTELKDIVLCLVGKGECTWSESRRAHPSHGNSTHQTRHVTYRGTEIYVQNYISILNKPPGHTAIVKPGVYEQHFQFILPENIPPSFSDSTCSITYKISLTFEKPSFFSFNKKFSTHISVYGVVRPEFPEGRSLFGLDKSLLKPFSKRNHLINVKADISNSLFSPGQNAVIAFTVTNNTDVKITAVRSELECLTTYTANCGRRKENTKVISESTIETPSVPADAVANMAVVLRIPAHLYSIQNSRIMTKEYKVKVTLRLPLPYINASVEFPIVIGEKREERYTEVAVFVNPDPSVEATQGMMDGPPSYWEVMNEDVVDKEVSGSKGND